MERFTLDWQARAIRPDGTSDWFPAEVPGNVQYDYARYMNWGDVSYGTNPSLFRETEGYVWEYRTRLSVPERAGTRAYFVTEGVDYIYDVLINGEVVLSHEGMFTRTEVDVTDRDGAELTVRIHPHPKSELARFEDRDQANQCVKPPVCYEWDWHPRLLVSGLWQDAYVELRGAGYIRRCEPFYSLSDDLSHADIRFEIDADEPVVITLYDPDGQPIGTGDHFAIDQPRLWWCNGQGEPALYRYVATTGDHTVEGTIGLRRIRMVMNAGAWATPSGFPKGRSAAPVQIELNNRRVFAKGSNWVNPDIFNGRIDHARYETLITLARDAHMNIFRCWGGSGINKKDFYDLCDRMGIMVWVEFPLACNNYVGTPHYLQILEQEARAILLDLRSHASVVLYCGGNELFNSWSGMTDQSHALRLLNKLCYELDFERPFMMTSPIFGMGHGGYTFVDKDIDLDVFALFQQSNCTGYTEFGVPGLTELDSLTKAIPQDELFPIHDTPSWRMHHAFGAWGDTRWLCMEILERYTHEPLDSIEKVIDQARWLQCEGYKAVFEEARRQAPHCSMAINWCYCEPWITAAGNSLITYPTMAKPAYYAVQSALRPVMSSARIPHFDWKAGERFAAELWLLNDSPDQVNRTVDVSIEFNGMVQHLLTWNSGEVAANTNQLGPTVNWILPDAPVGSFVLRLQADDGASSEYRLCFHPSPAALKSRQLNV